MKVLLTGAHFTPAQAVIEDLKKIKDIEIVYIGRNTTREGDETPSVESQILPKLGVKFIPITAGKIKKYINVDSLISVARIPVGFFQSLIILLSEKPDVIVSFGGYIGVPVVICGWILSIPVIVHEQTLVSGLANQVSNFFASKIAVTFNQKYSFSEKKLILTGNPLRSSLLTPPKEFSNDLDSFFEKCGKKPVILITGGNQGSHVINEVIKGIIPELTKRFIVIHQTGDSKFKDFESLSEIREKLETKLNYYLSKFIGADDWGLLLRKVDVAISRGGANTLLELAYIGIPTIIIPIPFIYKNEQVVNAKFFTKRGLGVLLEQSNLTEDSLLQAIEEIFSDYDSYKNQAKNAKEVVILGASRNIVKEILSFKK